MQGQGWCSGESTRIPSMWPGFDYLSCCHTRVEFFGSSLCSERFFPGHSGFSPLTKNQQLIMDSCLP